MSGAILKAIAVAANGVLAGNPRIPAALRINLKGPSFRLEIILAQQHTATTIESVSQLRSQSVALFGNRTNKIDCNCPESAKAYFPHHIHVNTSRAPTLCSCCTDGPIHLEKHGAQYPSKCAPEY